MNNRLLAPAVLASAVTALVAPGTSTAGKTVNDLNLSFRVGLNHLDIGEAGDPSTRVTNFGTRFRWRGSEELGNGLKGIGYAELGVNPNNNSRGSSGIDRTRFLWGGLEGSFGTIKIGAQYSAFYDMISSHADIAWWGSCFIGFECGRETGVLKYNGSAGPLSFAASVDARSGDDDEDTIDEFEVGVNYNVGNFTFGVGVGTEAGEDDDTTIGDDGGTMVGLLAKGAFGPVKVGVVFQQAESGYNGSIDDATNIRVTGQVGNFYGLIETRQDEDRFEDDPTSVTVGWWTSLGGSALAYFEAQQISNDPAEFGFGSTADDNDLILRATYVYTWKAFSSEE